MKLDKPVVGEPYRYGLETLICTYVVEAEKPLRNGACHTQETVPNRRELEPAGWFVHFHYPDKTESYRRFIPWDAATLELELEDGTTCRWVVRSDKADEIARAVESVIGKPDTVLC